MQIKKNQKGQSTIEFVLTFAFSLGVLFLFINLSLNSVGGYMAHLATYMSSRTYLVYDHFSNNNSTNDRIAAEKARNVFDSFSLKAFGLETSSNNLEINDPEGGYKYQFVGVYTKFKQILSIFSAIGGTQETEMISESFMGREPTRLECLNRVCKVIGDITGGDCAAHVTLYDNGC